jgi:hypothetical protein
VWGHSATAPRIGGWIPHGNFPKKNEDDYTAIFSKSSIIQTRILQKPRHLWTVIFLNDLFYKVPLKIIKSLQSWSTKTSKTASLPHGFGRFRHVSPMASSAEHPGPSLPSLPTPWPLPPAWRVASPGRGQCSYWARHNAGEGCLWRITRWIG